MRVTAILLAASFAGLMSSAGQAEVSQPQSGQSSAAPKKALDPNQMVCEKQAVPGSRLAVARVCHTRAEWADLRSQDRQEIERVQTRRGMQDH